MHRASLGSGHSAKPFMIKIKTRGDENHETVKSLPVILQQIYLLLESDMMLEGKS